MIPSVILITKLVPETEKLLDIAIRIGFTVLIAFLLQRGFFLVIVRAERFIARHGHDSKAALQRARTVGQILRNLVTVIVATAALIHALEVLGWDVKPLLAGAGIIGVGLGLGAQSLVRDVIAGVFILAENQFSVGDLVEVNGKPATVEALTVRCTVLRDFNGFVHFVPNGEMKIVTNRSRDWTRIALDLVVASDQDLERAIALCRDVLTAFNAEPRWRDRLLDPAELWGVESLGAAEATLRVVLRSRPGSGVHEVARELRRRLHQQFAAAGIRSGPNREIALVSAGFQDRGPAPDTANP